MSIMVSPSNSRSASRRSLPPFEPHPWFRGGHRQTIGGRYLPGWPVRLPAVEHRIDLGDGDRLSVWESVPEGWRPGGPAAVLVPGLCGSAAAPYVVRVAARLLRLGARVLRVNLRGTGSGFGLARGTYHSGRTEDLRAVVGWLAEHAPGAAIALVGFSLGGNLVLKLAAEAGAQPLEGLDCVLAANPPIDLSACSRQLRRPENRLYDRNFVRTLRHDVIRRHAAFPELGPVDLSRVRNLYELDDVYTAPRHGFAGAEDYYARCSAGPLIPKIAIPGLVIHAEDDPFIPPDPFRDIPFPPHLTLELVGSGGHLGYLSKTRWQGDHRWLDARLTVWLAERWEALDHPPPRVAAAGALPLHPGGQGIHVGAIVQ
jgi:predicted alpha/beta-fold hydrolase